MPECDVATECETVHSLSESTFHLQNVNVINGKGKYVWSLVSFIRTFDYGNIIGNTAVYDYAVHKWSTDNYEQLREKRCTKAHKGESSGLSSSCDSRHLPLYQHYIHYPVDSWT